MTLCQNIKKEDIVFNCVHMNSNFTHNLYILPTLTIPCVGMHIYNKFFLYKRTFLICILTNILNCVRLFVVNFNPIHIAEIIKYFISALCNFLFFLFCSNLSQKAIFPKFSQYCVYLSWNLKSRYNLCV